MAERRRNQRVSTRADRKKKAQAQGKFKQSEINEAGSDDADHTAGFCRIGGAFVCACPR